ncbi:hypothetical protein OHT77_38590 [Streptomyces sp. NBC_00252]|uniref:hypothetical protein n=1 Tax=Streptomyces sp. NBC_00252 TaxID=2975691 RepID=UPI002E2C488B|nr:hypothetical protein [Streptomyces sp. NBC_00252]
MTARLSHLNATVTVTVTGQPVTRVAPITALTGLSPAAVSAPAVNSTAGAAPGHVSPALAAARRELPLLRPVFMAGPQDGRIRRCSLERSACPNPCHLLAGNLGEECGRVRRP